MLASEMGTGKTRCALVAAQHLYASGKIDRVLILAPAAVRSEWRKEMDKLELDNKTDGVLFLPCIYDVKKQIVYGEARKNSPLPMLVLSYSLLPQKRHVEALEEWCANGKTLLVCDESSFLKNRTTKQTKASAILGRNCAYRWLLTGTPIANSPLDLYAQALVMADGDGPLKQFKNFYIFRARYAVLKMMNMGALRFQQVVGYQNLDELTKRFAPYVLRREKKDCLDLPSKTYITREVALDDATWKIYQELKREAMLCLPDSEEKPEPNAAVRILRLCQLTSGHVGGVIALAARNVESFDISPTEDTSSEKLDYLADSILSGELSAQQAIIVWCRWRRERERLLKLLATKIEIYSVFGGQQEKNRTADVGAFNASKNRRVLVAQPHAGGYGLNLTAASTAVYLSNDFSHTTRVQSEDRIHRIGQNVKCLYVDILATGPAGQKSVDHHVLDCLRAKKSLADVTCKGWRKVLAE